MAARQQSLNFRPGTEYSHSNTGYVLLAIIVERVSAESLAMFSRDQLFEPLGLVHTRWRDDFRAVVKGRAVAYDADSNGYHQFMPFENVIGSGGLLTTAGDLAQRRDSGISGVPRALPRPASLHRTALQRGRRDGRDFTRWQGHRPIVAGTWRADARRSEGCNAARRAARPLCRNLFLRTDRGSNAVRGQRRWVSGLTGTTTIRSSDKPSVTSRFQLPMINVGLSYL